MSDNLISLQNKRISILEKQLEKEKDKLKQLSKLYDKDGLPPIIMEIEKVVNKWNLTLPSGIVMEGLDSLKDCSFLIFVNKENALSTGGNINVGAHEFLHGVLFQTTKGDSKIQKPLLRLGLPDRYIFENGDRDYHLDNNGLSVDSIYEKVTNFINGFQLSGILNLNGTSTL